MHVSVPSQTRTGRSLLIGTLMFAASCDLFEGDCTTEARPGLEVAVHDQADKPLTIPPSITVTDGDFVERYPRQDRPGSVLPSYSFAVERPGEYSIRVEAAGYRVWQKSGVTVKEGSCGHVKTVRVTARLIRRV